MVFSSITFLFLFLPFTLTVYYLSPHRLRNFFLLIMSLLFYFWGSGQLLALILVSIVVDYLLGWAQSVLHSRQARFLCVGASLLINLGLLGYFKYANFFVNNLNYALQQLGLPPWQFAEIALPIGISFYTFQTLSYQIDLYRDKVKFQPNLIDFSLFVALFPQLIAGPIVRYKDINAQIQQRNHNSDAFLYGIYRFCTGLAKKVLIADHLAPIVDRVYSTNPQALSPGAAWIGTVAFLFQIYYDFSGYSDMAIGLSRMFGFKIRENFNYPYIARSITALWQRWHISLTTWFRDYLYSPLSSRNDKPWRSALNVYIVFILCGFWHGANWTFIAFGVFFGNLLVLEHFYWKKVGSKLPKFIQHCYVLISLLIALIFFRSTSLSYAFSFLSVFLGLTPMAQYHLTSLQLLNNELLFVLAIAALFSTPIIPWLHKSYSQSIAELPRQSWRRPCLRSARIITLTLTCIFLFSLSAIYSSVQTYQPFIYFQF